MRNGKTAEVRVILILAAVDTKQHAGALEEVADILTGRMQWNDC